MISAFANSFKIPELRQRIIFTLVMIVVVRLGGHIPLPGIDPTVVEGWIAYAQSKGGTNAAFAQLLNVFSGGSIAKCAVFSLGIMPYISASIMMQLLTAVVPRLAKLAREDGGRMKINQYTRYAAIVLCVLQGYLMAKGLAHPADNPLLPRLEEYLNAGGHKLIVSPLGSFYFTAVLTMTAGTMLLMWLGDQITERGVGNGVSIIISANIISELPGALVTLWQTYIVGEDGASGTFRALTLVLLIALLLAVIAGVIAITQAARRISIQYAKRQVGRKVVGGQNTYLPLKINYSGVMPIIFASAILMFPAYILSYLSATKEWGSKLQDTLSPNNWPYYACEGVLIFFFSYFWVATMFQPTQISEDLKKNGGYIPGIRPGKPTADFLDFTMSRLTFAGAIFLVIIAVLPTLITRWAQVAPIVGQFFGGTSILILVGVLLDLMRQVETYLIQKHYDGFLRKGRLKGRSDRAMSAGAQAGANITWLLILISLIVVAAACFAVFFNTK